MSQPLGWKALWIVAGALALMFVVWVALGIVLPAQVVMEAGDLKWHPPAQPHAPWWPWALVVIVVSLLCSTDGRVLLGLALALVAVVVVCALLASAPPLSIPGAILLGAAWIALCCGRNR
jgi:hypothetical protein